MRILTLENQAYEMNDIPDEVDDLRFAIYKKGTKPQRFMAKSLEKNRVTFARKIGKELSRQSNGKIVKR